MINLISYNYLTQAISSVDIALLIKKKKKMQVQIEELQTQTPNETEGQMPPSEITEVEDQDALLLQQAIRFSLQEYNKKTYSKQNGLCQKYCKMIKNLKMSKSSQKCSVCLCNFETDQIIKRLPCKHIFHRQCAKNWLKVKKTCPVCRLDLQEHFQKEETKINLKS